MKKNAIITGGSRGLGEDMVLRLAKMGYNVVVNFVSDRSRPKAEALLDRIKQEYDADGLAVQADVSDYAECKKIVDASVEKFGKKIDVLINNAGIDNNISFLKITPEQYTRLLNVNLMSYLHCSHLVLPYMVEAKEGCIVNVSSVGGLMGVNEQADYCASKSGIIGLTRALAVEFGPAGVRVNTLAPGMIWTDMLRQADQAGVDALKQVVPLGEIGEVDDISDCMEYLLQAKYVTGQTISPNGGLVMP